MQQHLNVIPDGYDNSSPAVPRQRHDDDKPVIWWLAYPCDSREAAYPLEAGLLAARKPPLNVKAGR